MWNILASECGSQKFGFPPKPYRINNHAIRKKLKIVFSTSIIRCLPHLLKMRIKECKELKNIIELDDLEDKKSSKTCFPKLGTLVVVKCIKLNHVFPISICKELPELNYLIIREAYELEEIFVSEGDDHKVEIPNLKVVIFENLPKLSLASASTADFIFDINGLYASKFGYGTHSIQYF
ncbi:hypothetical protein MtrunA17_Chr2g0288311 [Medicago truncatula]|uniref:Disease resistance protein At4g27190-like leucine-rich repeats domain-containing protein n=1 Tax=Medicago truncatula TaxID=3880 RepID=A0A396JBG7_MEDTR|nr:hypothetical protein MtrunA17_Chr2g0288311 [Medicago truncatula]